MELDEFQSRVKDKLVFDLEDENLVRIIDAVIEVQEENRLAALQRARAEDLGLDEPVS